MRNSVLQNRPSRLLLRSRSLEELGNDLREEVFDGLLDAAGQCEKARRFVWKHTQSPRDQVERWIHIRLRELRKRHEYWRLGREVAKIRKRGSPQPMG